MVRVSRAVFACAVFVWLVAVSVAAQIPVRLREVPEEAKKMKAPVASSPEAIKAGAQLFAKYCRFCHGTTGAGNSPMAPKDMKPSNLTDTTWTRGSSEGEIFWIIQNGAPPDYQMKPLKGKVSDADTWNLVHFVRSLGGVPKP